MTDVSSRCMRRFAAAGYLKCRSGMAATEFALILPALLFLFFGVVEGSEALSQSRRASLAANTLADLASQESELKTSDLDDLFTGVEHIVVTGGGDMTIRLVSVVSDKTGDPVVEWSRDNKGGEPYAPGAPYDKLPDASLLADGSSIIVGEISYPYVSPLAHYFIKSVTFKKLATRWPRSSLHIKLCTPDGKCGT